MILSIPIYYFNVIDEVKDVDTVGMVKYYVLQYFSFFFGKELFSCQYHDFRDGTTLK